MPGGVLGHRMTNKIALQIILAIEYLHNNKVIYRDLKAQNILLFSPKEDDVVNVKLSDYGISIVAQPSFNKGQEGTRGIGVSSLYVSIQLSFSLFAFNLPC